MKKFANITFAATFLITTTLYAQQNDLEKPIRDFQFSAVPFIGTEGVHVLDYQYRLSFNLLGGITGGIAGFEAGGILNITSGDVNGIQLSGFGNLGSGNLHAFQAAGFFNVNAGNVRGFRGAGFINASAGSSQGFQGSGFMNVIGGHDQGFLGSGFANIIGGEKQGFAGAGFANVIGGNSQGFLGAGFANVSGGGHQGFMGSGFANIVGGSYQGFAGAGFANIVGGGYQGFAGAGFANLARGSYYGFQGSGFGSISRGSFTGVQASGFISASRGINGLQASGFINLTGELKGLQLAPFNLADTISKGVPIGFLSIVRKGGFRQAELATSDVMHLSASFRMGTEHFYNIFTLAMRLSEDSRFSTFGYGFGTEFSTTEKTSMQLELHSTQLHDRWRWNKEELDLLNEFRVNIGYHTNSMLSLFAGVVVYNQFSKEDPDHDISGRDIAPGRVFHDEAWRSYVLQWWLGARGGVRLRI